MPAWLEPPDDDGTRPVRGAARLVALGAPPLTRVRRLFLVLALVACALAVIAVAGAPDRTPGLRLAGVAAAAALAAIWTRSYRRGRLGRLDAPIELSALFAVGVAAGPDPALALVYTGLYLRSLYGSREGVVAGFFVYAVAHGLAVAADGAGYSAANVLAQLPPLAIGAGVMHAFGAVLVEQDESLRRERILRRASAAIAAAPDRPAVHAAVLEAVDHVVPGRATAAVATRSGDGYVVRAATGQWLPGIASARVATADLSREVAEGIRRGAPCAIDSPRAAGLELFAPAEVAAEPGVCVPLVARGDVRGTLTVFGREVASRGQNDAIATLAAEAALALAALDHADAAADDRSIARVTAPVPGMI
jgi:hypothetical protein